VATAVITLMIMRPKVAVTREITPKSREALLVAYLPTPWLAHWHEVS
jgi:hypothetical protein